MCDIYNSIPEEIINWFNTTDTINCNYLKDVLALMDSNIKTIYYSLPVDNMIHYMWYHVQALTPCEYDFPEEYAQEIQMCTQRIKHTISCSDQEQMEQLEK